MVPIIIVQLTLIMYSNNNRYKLTHILYKFKNCLKNVSESVIFCNKISKDIEDAWRFLKENLSVYFIRPEKGNASVLVTEPCKRIRCFHC